MTSGLPCKDELRRLDACLQLLEDGLERGEKTLSDSLAPRLLGRVPRIEGGMPLTAALHEVFRHQEAWLKRCADTSAWPDFADTDGVVAEQPGPSSDPPRARLADRTSGAMSLAEARAITQRIKAAAVDLEQLFLEAHDRRAWLALGYRSWHRYIKAEFGFSRSRSYEILDQARVSRALRAATGGREIPHISARAAAGIKPTLAAIVAAVEARLATGTEDPRTVVTALVREALLGRETSCSADRCDGEIEALSMQSMMQAYRSHVTTREVAWDLRSLGDAVDFLAEMPWLCLLWSSFSSEDLARFQQLPVAAARLSQLAHDWSLRTTSTAFDLDTGSITRFGRTG